MHLLTLDAVSLSAQATIIWTGGGSTDDFYDNANWDFSGSPETIMPVAGGNPSADTADDILISGATISEPSGAFTSIEIGDGFSVTLDATSFIFSGSSGFSGVNDVADVTSTLSLNNGSSYSAQFATIGIDIQVDGTSTIEFRGGGDPINSVIERTRIILAPGAQLILPTLAEFTEQGADILVGGVSFADDPSILSITGTTGTAIPEPSFLLPAAIGSFGLLRRRRK